jgi:hypothetical protein
VEIQRDGAGGESEARTQDGLGSDGRIYVVPSSPSQWSRSVDVGASTFRLAAPLSLPPMLKSADLAQIRAVFNDAVDRRTIETTVNADVTRLETGGRTAPRKKLNDVELVQIVVETLDGRVFVQSLSIGIEDSTWR